MLRTCFAHALHTLRTRFAHASHTLRTCFAHAPLCPHSAPHILRSVHTPLCAHSAPRTLCSARRSRTPGAEYPASALLSIKHFVSLNLSNNMIGQEDATAMFKAATKNKNLSLQRLNWCLNRYVLNKLNALTHGCCQVCCCRLSHGSMPQCFRPGWGATPITQLQSLTDRPPRSPPPRTPPQPAGVLWDRSTIGDGKGGIQGDFNAYQGCVLLPGTTEFVSLVLPPDEGRGRVRGRRGRGRGNGGTAAGRSCAGLHCAV
jgi:hypothetical protein